MKHPSGPRKTANLSKSIHHQLNAYAITAGAAGVSLLALAQPAEAKIVYTPAHIRIAQNGSIQLDLNHDGIPDFTITSFYRQFTTFTYLAMLGVGPAQNSHNEIWGIQSVGIWWAAALSKNVRIGSNAAFQPASILYLGDVGRDYNRLYGGGPWIGNKRAYLGLKFQISGKIHYGWARLDITAQLSGPLMHPLIQATLTGYAYETIPGKSIKAGQTKGPDDIVESPDAALTVEPATLGRLALGAQGIALLRRKESAGVTFESN